jgi:uncharacterized repeat protein (TIGR03803 family)
LRLRGVVLCRFVLSASVAATLLAGCGGSQEPIGVSGGSQPPMVAAGAVVSSSYEALYSFRGSEGASPYAGLTNVGGTLYGTTYHGGANRKGAIVSVSTTGKEKVLHSLGNGSDGAYPAAALINVNGTLYGTTRFGGTGCSGSGASGSSNPGCGTVFSVTTTGRENVLYSFGGGSDGERPQQSLIDVNGTLYGTTASGGGPGCKSFYGCGTVFSVTTTGTEKVLYRFAGGSDGGVPLAGLINVDGTLYGTTVRGGGSRCGGTGCGYHLQRYDDRHGEGATPLRDWTRRRNLAARRPHQHQRYALRHNIYGGLEAQ